MLVIFDLDGTLLNTIADLTAAANYALEKTGFPTHAPEAYPYFVGNGVRRLLERVLPEDARTESNIDTMMTHFRAYYESHMADLTVPIPESQTCSTACAKTESASQSPPTNTSSPSND